MNILIVLAFKPRFIWILILPCNNIPAFLVNCMLNLYVFQ